MNMQEQQQLAHFLEQLVQVRTNGKDVEAERLINEACARQPDAAYLLVQRALLLDHALQEARAQAESLRAEVAALRGKEAGNGSGFLGKGWDSSPPATAQSPAPAPSVASPGSSFLRGMATTAAGVVAGSFLFQGIESLLGHREGGWANGYSSAPASPAENTVVNNYFLGDSSGDLSDAASFGDVSGDDWV